MLKIEVLIFFKSSFFLGKINFLSFDDSCKLLRICRWEEIKFWVISLQNYLNCLLKLYVHLYICLREIHYSILFFDYVYFLCANRLRYMIFSVFFLFLTFFFINHHLLFICFDICYKNILLAFMNWFCLTCNSMLRPPISLPSTPITYQSYGPKYGH